MTIYITDAQIDTYEPGPDPSDPYGDEPDYSIPGEDVYSFDVEAKVGDLKDTGKFALDNEGDQYTGVIDHGHKIEITVQGDEINGPVGFGARPFGDGPFGDSSESRVWTGLIRDWEITYHGAGVINFAFDAEDFVFAVMGFRRVYNEWRDRQIVGSNGILNEILMDKCPEIDRSNLPDRPERTSISAHGRTVLEVATECMYRLPAVMRSWGDSLLFDHPDTLSPRFELESRDYGVPTIGSQDTNMENYVRIRGGTAPALDDQQLTQDGTQTVTDSSFATQRIDTRKSFISEFHLFLQADREGEDVIVRIQKDAGDGSGPIAPDDETSDIASKRLSAEFLDANGFTPFLMPTGAENVLPEPEPWIIVQSEGSEGQDIGIETATGELTYKAFYPYPIVLEQGNPESMTEYLRRDGEVDRRSITTFPEAQDQAESYLNEHGIPTRTMKFDAQSPRMHAHQLGYAIQVDEPAAEGAFVAMEKKDHYEGNQLTTDFSFQSLESI